MTRFGKMVYGLGVVYFAIATYIIIQVMGHDSIEVLFLFGIGWLLLGVIFVWNILRSNKLFYMYKEAFEKLEEQYTLRGRIGEMTREERFLITLGENYIRDGVFGKRKLEAIKQMVSRINQFANEGKGE